MGDEGSYRPSSQISLDVAMRGLPTKASSAYEASSPTAKELHGLGIGS